jgi:hypothetical protein
MDFASIDFGAIGATLGTLGLLLAVDTVLGAAAAAAGGTFKWEYLYAVGRTKGVVMFQIAILMLAGAATPFADFEVLGVQTDPFTALALGLAAPLAASLVASIGDNIGKKDATAPQGVTPEVPVP